MRRDRAATSALIEQHSGNDCPTDPLDLAPCLSRMEPKRTASPGNQNHGVGSRAEHEGSRLIEKTGDAHHGKASGALERQSRSTNVGDVCRRKRAGGGRTVGSRGRLSRASTTRGKRHRRTFDRLTRFPECLGQSIRHLSAARIAPR